MAIEIIKIAYQIYLLPTTAVDAEEWYSRFVGKPKFLKESNHKFILKLNKDE